MIFSALCRKEEPFPIYQYLAMLTGTLSIVSSGMHYGWTSPSLPQLQHPNSTLPVTDDEGSWMAVAPLGGATLGAIFSWFILDVIGRKRGVLLTAAPFFASWLMVAYAKSVWVLLVARFIAGIGDGLAFCSVPMYLGEIADAKIRGLLGSSCSIMWIFGMLLINIIGAYTSIKVAALISSVFPVVLAATFVWMPESPYYLIMKGRVNEAKESLRIFKRSRIVEDELGRLFNAVQLQNTNTGKFLDLFTVGSNRRALLIVMGTRAIQQCSGALAFTFYANTIFKKASDEISSTTATIIYFSVQLIVASTASLVMDRTGRRPLLIVSVIGSGAALLLEGLYFYLKSDHPSLDVSRFSYIPVAALIGFVVLYGIGLQSIPILILGELFPTNVKAFALGLADIYFNVVATLVSKFFQAMKDHYGMHVPFFSFSVCCAAGLFFILFFVPETKGKTLEQIQDEFKCDVKRRESFKQIADVCFERGDTKFSI
ncbi:facilitated trehalose transporter Tret1-like [Photinus pyralis]|uniref:facilitated trehalose transporter Tret1-like n=1 Tax=Photinus pyralis TaxID=7054 RepID=UPI0012677C7C|nr:facilitated trehalose transporter Tret1-like [Photinus pyralis]